MPSRRFRVAQLIPTLLEQGINIDELVPLIPKYPPKQLLMRPFWFAGAIIERLPFVYHSYRADIVLFQREMISTLVTLEPFCKRPRIFDVDDAIFLRRNGRAAKKIAQSCDLVVCGNSYLAERFAVWNKSVVIIPTAVDSTKYTPTVTNIKDGEITIGWIGSSSNLTYLLEIEDALFEILNNNPETRLKVICNSRPRFKKIPDTEYVFTPWSPSTEVSALQSISIGIMPLRNTDWEKGKCSYKMLQYMSCGKPVVVSPVSMNKTILGMGNIGYGASSKEDWIACIGELIESPAMRNQMGLSGRQIVENYFDISRISKLYADAFRSKHIELPDRN